MKKWLNWTTFDRATPGLYWVVSKHHGIVLVEFFEFGGNVMGTKQQFRFMAPVTNTDVSRYDGPRVHQEAALASPHMEPAGESWEPSGDLCKLAVALMGKQFRE